MTGQMSDNAKRDLEKLRPSDFAGITLASVGAITGTLLALVAGWHGLGLLPFLVAVFVGCAASPILRHTMGGR